MPNLLTIHDLEVGYAAASLDEKLALNGVSFELDSGEILGILGESGCGKTTLAKTLTQSLPRSAVHLKGKIELEGQPILLNDRTFKRSQIGKIVAISQDPGLHLNPVIRVGDQVAEVFRAHQQWNKDRIYQETKMLLESLELDSREIYDAYPHQISGGQQQRIVIAQALACSPSLIIADEPTASLDTDTESKILKLLRNSVRERKMALILITHNPAILADFAERILILYAGRVVECGSQKDVYATPLHPYTNALLACMRVASNAKQLGSGIRFPTIPGTSQRSKGMHGCSFASRCAQRIEICTEEQPNLIQTTTPQSVECFLYGH